MANRGKAAQAIHARKLGDKINRARENWNPETAKREAEADHEYVLEQAAKRKRAPGGGRKPLAGPDDPTREQVVTMPASLWAKARTLGDGNASAGIRVALERAATLSGPGRDRDQRDQTQKRQ